MVKVLPLQGYKSLRALNAFNALLLGLKMLPIYITENYETFYESFKERSEDEKEKLIRQAVLFVQLEKDEVDSLLSFCTDKNGVPYDDTNIKNLKPDQLHECIVSVCMEIGKIKIEILSEAEKKKSPNSPSISDPNT